MGWTSIYQLFWGSLGTRVLTHSQLTNYLLSTRRPILRSWKGRAFFSPQEEPRLHAAARLFQLLEVLQVGLGDHMVIEFGDFVAEVIWGSKAFRIQWSCLWLPTYIFDHVCIFNVNNVNSSGSPLINHGISRRKCLLAAGWFGDSD